ncbi:MAG: MFS transporter, partial [Simkaniaceae bacterium]|nr:MFS transporter [Simkaniaceae bacterium]
MVLSAKEVQNSLEELLGLSSSLAKAKCLSTLKMLYRARYTDEKMQKLILQNKGGAFHLFTAGHELIGVVSALSLIPGKDWGLPYYRDRAFAIGIGCEIKDLFAAVLARKAKHHSSGRMMPDHFSHKELHLPCQSSVVGSQYLHAVGLAKGLMLQGKNEVVYVSGGEGSTSQGDFHEALNYACLHKLGVIFVVQDNGWAISMPSSDQTAGGSISKIASGYEGLSVHEIDGCDYEQVSKALGSAVQKGRQMEGPSIIVAHIPRLGAHSSSDDPTKYKSKEQLVAEKKLDPVPRFEKWLLKMGLIDEAALKQMQQDIFNEVEIAAKAAEEMSFPDPKSVLEHVFKKSQTTFTEEKTTDSESIVMMDALNHAISEEMEKDEGVLVFGQDVAKGKGGVFGITRGLTEKFGDDRCFNSSLAESTIIGTAIGLSFDGVHKPVVEIQFADYIWTGINQIFNELASIHYRSNGEWNCPVVIRLPFGGYIQGGPYHSQSIEAFLTHCPGLKVVIPSNSADAKRLLKTAIADPNPVLFLEHKLLYRQRQFSARNEPGPDEYLPFGKANIVREGSDITLVCWGIMVHMASEIAMQLEDEEIDVEIIDLRTLSPLDYDTIAKSIKKTGKLLIAHEAPLNCGFGAEIAARASEQSFQDLDAPVKRLGG